jgi:PAS domain S-box-containing protein
LTEIADEVRLLRMRLEEAESSGREHDRIVEELLRENRRLNVLNDLSTALLEHLADDDLLSAILDRATALVETRHGFVACANASGTTFEVKEASGLFAAALGRTFSSANDPEAFADFQNVTHVVLRYRDRVLGVLGVTRPAVELTEADRAALERFAGLAAIAILNSDLFRAERDARTHAETLLGAARALSSSLDLGEVLSSILAQLRRVIPCDSASVQEIRGSEAVVIAGHGFRNLDEIIGLTFDLDSENIPNGIVIRTGQPVILEDVSPFQDFLQVSPTAMHIRSWMGVPLIAPTGIVGMITVDKNEPGFYRQEHARLALSFASQAAIAIHNAQLYETAQRELAERNRMAERLRDAEAEYRTLVEQLPAITYRWSIESDSTGYISPQVQRLLGYSPEEWMSDADLWRKVIHPDDREWVLAALAEKDATGANIEMTHRFIARDGRVVWLQNQSRTISVEGRPRATHGVMLDVTPLKQIEEELRNVKEEAEAANKAKSAFLAAMSHELRTPLNAIIGFSAVLESSLASQITEKQLRFLHNINTSGEFLLGIINDILDLSKIEAGKMELEVEAVDVAESIEAICRVVKGVALQRNIELDVEVLEMVVWADPIRFKQIVYNLLSNAVKFSPDGSTVSVRVRALTAAESKLGCDSVEISVLDHGIGIDPADHESIFQEFRQVDRTPNRPHGTGLGLALVRRLLELMGGTIGLRSAAGKGSEFTVLLPASAPRTR